MPLYEYTCLKTPFLCTHRQGLRFLLLLTVHFCRVHPSYIHWHMKTFMELMQYCCLIMDTELHDRKISHASFT